MSGLPVDKLRWYQNPVLLLVLAIPLLAVVMGGVTLYLAFSGADTLVKDNYYREGLAINQEFGEEKRAVELRVRATLLLSGNDVAVTVKSSGPPPQVLQLAILHPLLPEHDRELRMVPDSEGVYRARCAAFPPGGYHLRLGSSEQGWLVRSFQQITPGVTLALP